MAQINIENEIAKLKDYSFFNRVMFLFENNKYVNSIFINEINDKEYSDFSKCENVIFDTNNACITIGDLSNNGIYSSSLIRSFKDEESVANDFFLITDDVMPVGTDIIYKIVSDSGEVVDITPNKNTPLILPNGESTEAFRLKAELKSNGINKPKINSIAIMYSDNLVNSKLNLEEPNASGGDFKRIDSSNMSEKYVLKQIGKGLSSNDFTDTDKDKLESLSNYEHPLTHEASMIVFSDNKTFQQKLEDGSLKGEKGDSGSGGGGDGGAYGIFAMEVENGDLMLYQNNLDEAEFVIGPDGYMHINLLGG